MASMLLIADIGGTNARFALADARSDTPLLDDSDFLAVLPGLLALGLSGLTRRKFARNASANSA